MSPCEYDNKTRMKPLSYKGICICKEGTSCSLSQDGLIDICRLVCGESSKRPIMNDEAGDSPDRRRCMNSLVILTPNLKYSSRLAERRDLLVATVSCSIVGLT